MMPAWRSRAAWAAAAVALAGAAQIALERWSLAPAVPPHLFRGRILPALLWVAAAPVVVRLGARFPARAGRIARDLGLHAALLTAWLLLTNLLLRLPDAARLGWGWVLDDTRAGLVRYTPTAVLLWIVLAWLGRAPAGPTAGEGTEDHAPASVRQDEGARDGPTPGIHPVPDARTALPVPGLNRVHLVPLERIRYLEADGDHVRVHTTEGEHRMRARLSELERRLTAGGTFVRIHRSHLVQLAHVREVQPLLHGDWVAVMSDGAELRIPRTRRRALDRILGKSASA